MSDLTNETTVLDHGYLKLVNAWGSDEGIVEAARMSTAKGFKGWGAEGKPGDEKLLRYLWTNKHATPFEMAGLTIEVKAPIFVFRQWHRHRTQCLAPDTLVHFERLGKGGKRYVYKMRIEDVWKKWQPTVRRSRPERQTNALHKRQRISAMALRCMDEETQELGYTHVVDVIKGEPKPMVRVITASGRSVVATRAHRFVTSRGWDSLGNAIRQGSMLALEGTTRAKAMRWETPVVDEVDERWKAVVGWEQRYEVSSWGRVRRINCKPKKNTPGAHGYDVVSLSREGKSYAYTVHRLVLDAFVGPCPAAHEARHLNANRGDPRLENLRWGTAAENAADRIQHDRQQRLCTTFEEIVSVEEVGSLPTYDLSVEGPWHNFVADGFVVHNSYNEMSARYTPLPNENYIPTVDRLLVNSKINKQAGTVKGADALTPEAAELFRAQLAENYARSEQLYQAALASGVPKELARVHLPVARYSRMRASANLRNWLGFLTLRLDPHAQHEVRVYAEALGQIIEASFPRTWELFAEGLA